MQELHEIQSQAGATFTEAKTPNSFGNDREAIGAAYSDVALCDRSGWSLLKLSGEDRLRFLHNQTTNDINRFSPGQGGDTVFVTSTGRTIDLATVYVTEAAVLVLVSPGCGQRLIEWMDRFIFPFDRVELTDLGDAMALFTLIGPQSQTILKSLSGEAILSEPEGSHTLVQIGDASVRVAVGSGLSLPGYTLIVPLDKAAQVWSTLQDKATLLGDRVWEQLRILQGRPAPGRELTDDYNPLEAGLWRAISFEKGCYIGQETIARLNTYQGVKQKLWGVQLEAPVQPNTDVTIAGSKVGVLTSYADTQEAFGLAYIRTKAGGAGLQVQVGDTPGELVTVPFITHDYYQPQK